MHPTMRSGVEQLRRRAENVVSILLGIMFVAFILQIVFRYFFNFPVGWTSELSVLVWLYMVLLGSALWLRESDEIRFDLFTGRVSRNTRRVIGIFLGIVMVILYGASLPATIRYVSFMKVESLSYIPIRLDFVYSVYIVFAVAFIVRYLWSIWALLKHEEEPADTDEPSAVSGL